MAKLQAALKNSLREELEKLGQRLGEAKRQRQQAEKEREAVGVQLFGLQKQLVGFQQQLDQTAAACAAGAEQRKALEAALEEETAGRARMRQELVRLDKEFLQAQEELTKATETLQVCVGRAEEVGRRLRLDKNEALAQEKVLAANEQRKKRQDFLAGFLQDEVRRLEARRTLLAGRILAQKAEAAEARRLLAAAGEALEAARRGKKELTGKWQQGVAALQKLADAAAAVKAATKYLALLTAGNRKRRTTGWSRK